MGGHFGPCSEGGSNIKVKTWESLTPVIIAHYVFGAELSPLHNCLIPFSILDPRAGCHYSHFTKEEVESSGKLNHLLKVTCN